MAPILRRKYLVAGLAMAGLVGAVLVSFCLPRTFEATARVRVVDNHALYQSYAREGGGKGGAARAESVLLADAVSTRAVKMAIRELGLDAELDDDPAGVEEKVRELSEATVVELGEVQDGVRVLRITHRSADALTAQRVASFLACSLQSRHRVKADTAAQSELRELREELSVTRRESEVAAEELAAFEAEHAAHRLGQPDDTKSRHEEEMKRVRGMEKELAALGDQLESIKAQLEDEPEWLEEAGEKVKNPTYTELRKSELEVLSAITVADQVRSEYQSRVDALEERMAEFPATQRRWAELKARKSTLASKVASLVDRESLAGAAWLEKVASETMILEVEEVPAVPTRPQEPRRAVFWGAGILFGLTLGLGLVLIMNSLNRSFRTSGELASATDVPMLGAISVIETIGEQETSKRKRQRALGLMIGMFLLAGAAVFLHMKYDAEITSVIGKALENVK